MNEFPTLMGSRPGGNDAAGQPAGCAFFDFFRVDLWAVVVDLCALVDLDAFFGDVDAAPDGWLTSSCA